MSEKMKLWELRPIDFDNWEFLSFGSIVAAPTEERARQAVSESSGKEWLDIKLTFCRELLPEEFEVDCVVISSDCCIDCWLK